MPASVSRVRLVSMAALTTMLGLLPLLFDVFFGAMAVTIICGLAFATGLTLLVVPVLFAVFFRVIPPEEGWACGGRPQPLWSGNFIPHG